MRNRIRQLLIRINSLTIFRGMLNDCLIQKWIELLHATCDDKRNPHQFVGCYSECFYMLVKHRAMCQSNDVCSMAAYLADAITYRETSVSQMAGQSEWKQLPDWLIRALEGDLSVLGEMASLSSREIKSTWLENGTKEMAELIENLPEWDNQRFDHIIFGSGKPWSACAQALIGFYRSNGSGLFARYRGFIWERKGDIGQLRGLDDPDPVKLNEFIGYELQRKEIIENTLQFINGYPANNLLLYGDRGTGKSSTVKALLNEYHSRGLRMIEMPRQLLADFNEVMRIIRTRPQRFIIFVDDLSFDDNEDSYTALKAVLEGSLENTPENILIYVTSNRRHLIKERFSDRTGLASNNIHDEIHAADTMEEKLSLADRFGMTVTFTAPDQEEYLRIVDGLAAKRGLKIDRDFLHREAVRWEMQYNGRSPRTALQFIRWMEGQTGMQKERSGEAEL